MDPHVDHLIQRGRRAFEHGDYRAALADFREVLERQPTFADVRHLAGLCLNFLGEPEAALEEFDRALSLNDGYIEAHLSRALTLNDLGRYEEAQEAFHRASDHGRRVGDERFPAAISARLANAHAERGDLYMAASAPEEAVVQYWAALELRPHFIDIRNKLAQALVQLGELDQAEAQLQMAVEANPEFLVARLNLGLIHYRSGRLEEAAAEWHRCREQAPDHPQVRAYLSMLEKPPVPHDPSGGESSMGDAAEIDAPDDA